MSRREVISYEAAVHRAVGERDWRQVESLWKQRAESTWRLDGESGWYVSIHGPRRKMSAEEYRRNEQGFQAWLERQRVRAEFKDKGAAAFENEEDEDDEEEEITLSRAKAVRTASAFQDTASVEHRSAVLRDAKRESAVAPFVPPPSSAKFAEPSGSAFADALRGSVSSSPRSFPSSAKQSHGSAAAPFVPESPFPRASAVPPSSASSSSSKFHEEGVAPFVPPPPSPHPLVPSSAPASPAIHMEILGSEVQPATVPPATPKPAEAVAELASVSHPIEPTTPAVEAPLHCLSESAYVGERASGLAFGGAILPSAGEIDALQSLKYGCCKVSLSEWKSLAPHVPVVLNDPCTRPTNQFLLMKHRKTGVWTRVYAEGKAATKKMSWTEICLLYRELYPLADLDLDTLVKSVLSSSSPSTPLSKKVPT